MFNRFLPDAIKIFSFSEFMRSSEWCYEEFKSFWVKNLKLLMKSTKQRGSIRIRIRSWSRQKVTLNCMRAFWDIVFFELKLNIWNWFWRRIVKGCKKNLSWNGKITYKPEKSVKQKGKKHGDTTYLQREIKVRMLTSTGFMRFDRESSSPRVETFHNYLNQHIFNQ